MGTSLSAYVRRRAVRIAALAAVGAGALLLVGCGGAKQPPTSVGHPPVEEAAELRTVLVVGDGTTVPSPTPSHLNAELVEGTMPATAAVATVLTDTNCAPDEAGISHCLNELRLADGSRLLLRHHHDMSIVPCLSPGEQVRIDAA